MQSFYICNFTPVANAALSRFLDPARVHSESIHENCVSKKEEEGKHQEQEFLPITLLVHALVPFLTKKDVGLLRRIGPLRLVLEGQRVGCWFWFLLFLLACSSRTYMPFTDTLFFTFVIDHPYSLVGAQLRSCAARVKYT
jgi:hypothetical protein